jgi:type II secretory pathway pseudopilin PulG
LVVIAIIAILSVVVVLTLNPTQKLQESRDANRLSDMQTLQSAISLYVTDTSMSGTPNLGSSTLTYLSLPDPTATTPAGSNCSSLGFPAGYFHCAGPNFYKKTDGTGWLPVNLASTTSGNPLGSLPIDPTNNASSGLYYSYATDGTTWKVGSIPESTKYASAITSFSAGSNQNLLGGFPNNGWISVPGNSTFGTQAFSVMKYDAVCSDGKGNASVGVNLDYNGYNNNTSSCTPTNGGRQIASLPGGNVIVDIAEQPTAKAYCNSIGAHLLTNDEYMTIAMNAVNVGSNWSGGSVGSGSVFSGHNDGQPNTSLPADANDANGYSGETNQGGTQRRTLTLSNGNVIWDMAGNVWQEVQRSNMNVGDNQSTMAVPSVTGTAGNWVWSEFANASVWPTDPSTALTASQVSPPNGWTSSKGMGQLYSWVGGGTSQGTNAFFRGGLWSYGGADGVFTLSLGWYTGGPNSSIGFRCAR